MSEVNIQIKNKSGDLLYPKTKAALVYNNSNQSLGTVEAGAQVNVIEAVKVNGTAVEVINKEVNINTVTSLNYDENTETLIIGG